MLIIHFGLIVFMAKNALEDFIIHGIHVAGRAVLPSVAMFAGIDAKILAVVIERGRQPGIQRVASRAVVGEIQRHVIRIRGALKVRLMTGETIHGRAGITIIHVALIARRRRVRAQQSKSCFVVIERRRLPCAGGVACGAVARKIRGYVIGIARALKIRLMA